MDGAAQALIGRTIAGKFLVEAYLGGGAMGAVYRARQLALDKDVALKVLHGEHLGDATYAARFQREARAASKLDHPNSMRVIDFGEEPDGLLYIAMELLDGRDLFRVLQREWPLAPARVADILSQALAAIAVAHEMGIVHRDLKPENIMILPGVDDEGRPRDLVKVCDFGIAKFTDARQQPRGDGGQTLTTHGIVVGTPEYMSPEQGKGEALDARSDLYAVGVILYQMLTARVPFDAESALGVVLKHVTEEPVPPRQVHAQADERLEAICLKAIRKKREDRYQSAREMRAELRVIGGTTDAALRTTTGAPPPVAMSTAATVRVDASAAALAPGWSATPSKVTPGATVAFAPGEPPRGRPVLVAVVALLALVAGFGGWWMLRVRRAVAPAPPLAASSRPAPPPLTTLAPLDATADPEATVPPLEPSRPALPSGAVRGATATPGGLAASPHPSAPTAPAASVPPGASSEPLLAPLPAGSFDASRAHVDWNVIDAGGGATAASAQHALSARAGRWTECYRTHLERRGERIAGQATMHLTADDVGTVVGERFSGFDAMPGVKQCIGAASRVHIEGVQTADAWVDVHLVFRPE